MGEGGRSVSINVAEGEETHIHSLSATDCC